MSDSSGTPIPTKIVFMVGCVAVAISIALAVIYEPKGIVEKILLAFVAEFGFACVIAVIIIIAVDRREKQEFREYITRSDRRLTARNLLAYVSDLDVPDEISREIEAYLNATPFIKEYQNYTVEIKKCSPDTVQVTFNTVAEYINIGQDDSCLQHHTSISRPVITEHDGKQNGIVFLRTEVFEKNAGTFRELSREDYSSDRKDKVTDTKVSGISVAPGGRLRVTIGAVKYHPVKSADYIRQQFLCQKMKFDFIYDKEDFELETLLFCPGADTSSDMPTASGKTLDVKRPFLVNNGILFRWHPKA